VAGEPHRSELAASAVPESLDSLYDLFARVGAEHAELERSDLLLLETATIEVAGNILEHGRPQGHVRWRFRLDVLPERLEAELSDSGDAFTGTVEAAMPSAEALTGRGLPLALALLDDFSYVRTEDENRWRMVRRTGQTRGWVGHQS